MTDDELASLVVTELRRYVDEKMAPVAVELSALREAAANIEHDRTTDEKITALVRRIDALPVPKDGKDADLDLVAAWIGERMAMIPVPKDGRDGVNGKDGSSVTIEEVAPLLTSEVQKAVAVLPAAKDGKDGRDGVNGKDADPLAIATQVRELIPTPRDGRDGIATREEVVTCVREAMAAALPDLLEKCIEEAVKRLPKFDHKGTWIQAPYEKGEAVTWGGSLWLCKADTETKPGTSDDWQLVVKRGRDGRDRTGK